MLSRLYDGYILINKHPSVLYNAVLSILVSAGLGGRGKELDGSSRD